MTRAAIDDPGGPGHEHEAQAAPVLFVVIDDQGDPGIRFDVADPAEAAWGGPFGLLVDRRVDRLPIDGEADGDDVGLAARIGRGEPGNPRLAEHRAGPHPP